MADFKGFQLSEYQKGFVYIIVGIVVLLYAFNFFQAWLNTLVILSGFALVAYGFIKVGGVEKAKALLAKNKKQ